MGSADGGQKDPSGSQLAEVQHGLDTFQEDGGEQQPDESQLGLPDGTQVQGGGQQMPERFSIRMVSEFGKEYAFEYEKKLKNMKIIYFCKPGGKRSSVAMEQTLHSQDGISGIARIFALKPRCYDAMMYFA